MQVIMTSVGYTQQVFHAGSHSYGSYDQVHVHARQNRFPRGEAGGKLHQNRTAGWSLTMPFSLPGKLLPTSIVIFFLGKYMFTHSK